MKVCPYCGAQNTQADAAYCSYCGSSLAGTKDSTAPPSQPQSTVEYHAPMRSYPSNTQGSSFGASERYEKALKRTERLGIAVAILSVLTLILLFA